jgi:hypothetical protein
LLLIGEQVDRLFTHIPPIVEISAAAIGSER